ncbi:chromosome partitioning protein ParB [Rhodoferax sp.]|uniref:chromosome partitioning protein ParB n=1 Tax=Rhodoferax sp. TaxID=50421 RepID=UPI001EBB68DF|nr:chromosome partitioning protein ParB [Rhodoferax sp.]MBT9508385.1 chromosome partitioning protein ParB [Rhodoferax sp.]
MSKPQQSNSQRRAAIGRRPGADPASAWVQQVDAVMAAAKASVYTARLTIDVTPVMRGRIKVVAFQRGITAVEMLRELLEREFPEGAP